jgi:alpha-tubulin suppressor-like RCC1 family protein
VWSWGKFENGRLGYTFEEISATLSPSIAVAPISTTFHTDFEVRFIPARIDKMKNRYCVQIAAQGDHSMALCSMNPIISFL